MQGAKGSLPTNPQYLSRSDDAFCLVQLLSNRTKICLYRRSFSEVVRKSAFICLPCEIEEYFTGAANYAFDFLFYLFVAIRVIRG
jgi:hypothetical protein